MNELKCSAVHVCLGIKRGKNFGFLQHPLLIEASLNGHQLDVGPLAPENVSEILAELKWETEKSAIRRLRQANTALKIECYAIVGQQKRECVGKLVLNLRYAKIQTESNPVVNEEWHKLFASRTNIKGARPALLLSFAIRSADFNTKDFINAVESHQNFPLYEMKNVDVSPKLITDEGLLQIGPEDTASEIFILTIILGAAKNLHLLLTEDISDVPETEQTFCFYYEILGFSIETTEFYLEKGKSCIFPVTRKVVIRIRSLLQFLKMYFEKTPPLQIKLLMPNKTKEVAYTNVDTRMFIPTGDLSNVMFKDEEKNEIIYEETCYLTNSNGKTVPVTQDSDKPSVNVHLKLKYIKSGINTPTGNEMCERGDGIHLNSSPTYTFLNTHNEPKTSSIAQGGGEIMPLGTDMHYSIKSLSSNHGLSVSDSHFVRYGDGGHDTSSVPSEEFLAKPASSCPAHFVYESGTYSQTSGKETDKPTDNVKQCIVQSVSETSVKDPSDGESYNSVHIGNKLQTVLRDKGSDTTVGTELNNILKSYEIDLHVFELKIFLETVQFHVFPPDKKIIFRFYHPKAERTQPDSFIVVVDEVDKTVTLLDTVCTLAFVCAPFEIDRLLLAWPPVINACILIDGHYLTFAHSTLNAVPLIASGKNECKFTVSLEDKIQSKKFGIIGISLKLQDCGLIKLEGKTVTSNISNASINTNVSSFDEQIAFKIIEELEEWKERQQEMFKANLMEKEKEHLTMLREEWYRRKEEIEARMTRDAEECKMLASQLTQSNAELRAKIDSNIEKELELRKMKDQLELKFGEKVQVLKSTHSQLEIDFNSKVAELELEKRELQHNLISLEKENIILRETMKQNEEQLDKLKSNMLTKEQTASMIKDLKNMEEKYRAVAQSRDFYKAHWARTIREVHRLKAENQENRQIHIRRSQESLKNLNIISILGDDGEKRQAEKENIEMLKKEINKMMANQESNSTNKKSLEKSTSHLSSDNSTSDIIMTEDEANERIKVLVEERDRLLKTGNYSINSEIIIQLDSEINSLLPKSQNHRR